MAAEIDPIDDEQGIWSDADRLPAKWREFRGWPPADVPMQIPIAPWEVMSGRTWPPPRLWTRQERLAMWRRVWRGDYTDFIGVLAPKARVSHHSDNWHLTEDVGAVTYSPVVINYPRRYIDIVSSLMMTVAPPDDIADPIQMSVMHAMRDGKAYIIRRGDKIEAVEAMWCYETSNMWVPEAQETNSTLYVVRPFISPMAQWDLPDMVEIIAIGGGMAVTWTAAWSQVWEYGAIGAQLTAPVATPGSWAAAHNPPDDYGWGQPAIQDLVPPSAEIALRYSGADRVLAAHEAPTLLVPIPNADIGSILAVDTSIDNWYEKRVANEIVKRLRDNNVAWRPDGMSSPEYLTWDGNLQATFFLIDMLKSDVRMLTGIPEALEQSGGDVPSGTALNQMLLLVWAGTKQLHRQVRGAYRQVYGAFEWGNAFEEAFAAAARSGGLEMAMGLNGQSDSGADMPMVEAGMPA